MKNVLCAGIVSLIFLLALSNEAPAQRSRTMAQRDSASAPQNREELDEQAAPLISEWKYSLRVYDDILVDFVATGKKAKKQEQVVDANYLKVRKLYIAYCSAIRDQYTDLLNEGVRPEAPMAVKLKDELSWLKILASKMTVTPTIDEQKEILEFLGKPVEAGNAGKEVVELPACEAMEVPVRTSSSKPVRPKINRSGSLLVKTVDGVEYRFRWCPAGTFVMCEKEKAHRVVLDGFWMLETEVTVEMFRSFVEATGYKSFGDKAWGKNKGREGFTQGDEYSWENPNFPQTDRHPVVCVSWWDAMAFQQWLGNQLEMTCCLPTEAQFEYACWQGVPRNAAEYVQMVWNDPSAVSTQPVGTKKPNLWGFYDLFGNVCEWCFDAWTDNYELCPMTNPQGNWTEWDRVRRGGAMWHDTIISVCLREKYFPDFRAADTGFRVVLSPSPRWSGDSLETIMTESQVWSYTHTDPSENWTQRYPLPDSKTGTGVFRTGQQWDEKKNLIWLTTKLNLLRDFKATQLTLRCVVDDHVNVFINGIRVAHKPHLNGAVTVQPKENPLKPGKNIVAV